MNTMTNDKKEITNDILIARYILTTPETEGGYQEGDIIVFRTEDTGELVQFEAMKINEDGTALFVSKDCVGDGHVMNKINTNKGGYEASEMRKYLNGEFLEAFPETIRSRMQPMKYGDYIRLLKYDELFDEESDIFLEPMRDRRKRVAGAADDPDGIWYWLQDTSEEAFRVRSSANFAIVLSYGFASRSSASYAYGIRPVITLI